MSLNRQKYLSSCGLGIFLHPWKPTFARCMVTFVCAFSHCVCLSLSLSLCVCCLSFCLCLLFLIPSFSQILSVCSLCWIACTTSPVLSVTRWASSRAVRGSNLSTQIWLPNLMSSCVQRHTKRRSENSNLEALTEAFDNLIRVTLESEITLVSLRTLSPCFVLEMHFLCHLSLSRMTSVWQSADSKRCSWFDSENKNVLTKTVCAEKCFGVTPAEAYRGLYGNSAKCSAYVQLCAFYRCQERTLTSADRATHLFCILGCFSFRGEIDSFHLEGTAKKLLSSKLPSGSPTPSLDSLWNKMQQHTMDKRHQAQSHILCFSRWQWLSMQGVHFLTVKSSYLLDDLHSLEQIRTYVSKHTQAYQSSIQTILDLHVSFGSSKDFYGTCRRSRFWRCPWNSPLRCLGLPPVHAATFTHSWP